MTAVNVTLAAEGKIDFAILRRLVREAGLSPGSEHGAKGKFHLDKRLSGYNHAAQHAPWVALRDLDQDEPCAGRLVARLLPHPAAFMRLRIVVRAAEAWLLADQAQFSVNFSVQKKFLPKRPEALSHPKMTTLDILSRSASKDIREAMVRKTSKNALQTGPEYNSLLVEFIENYWRPQEAARGAADLAKAMKRIAELR